MYQLDQVALDVRVQREGFGRFCCSPVFDLVQCKKSFCEQAVAVVDTMVAAAQRVGEPLEGGKAVVEAANIKVPTWRGGRERRSEA